MAGSDTDCCAPSQMGFAVTAVTVAVTGPLLSERLQVPVQRPVESVVHERLDELPKRSTMRMVTAAPFTAVPVELRMIFTRAAALYDVPLFDETFVSSLMVLRRSVVVVVGAVVVVVGAVVVVVGAVVVVVGAAVVVVVGAAVVVVEPEGTELLLLVSMPSWGRSPMSSLASV